MASIASRASAAGALWAVAVACAAVAPASDYLEAVVAYGDRVLESGRDTYGREHTPLFVDGLDARTLAPAEWVYGGPDSDPGGRRWNPVARRWQEAGERWILSDLANHQTMFRTFDGLTALTGERRYAEAAEAAMAFGMSELRARGGLLYWGGHMAYDCRRDVVVIEQPVHELKCQFPYYEMMERVSRRKTTAFVRAFWDAHILDWRSLDMDRHGDGFFWRPPPLRMWRRGSGERPPVPFVGDGRSFCNTGSDLMAAAAQHYRMHRRDEVLDWALDLARRYADARHPVTGLAGYQFSNTSDDRARAQFAGQFGPAATDATLLAPYMAVLRYPRMAITQLMIADLVGAGRAADQFRSWALDDLRAFARHGYAADTNMVHPRFIDGRRIVLEEIERAGHYYDPAQPARNTRLRSFPAGGIYFRAYAQAHRITGGDDATLRGALVALGRGNGLGADVLSAPDLATDCADADVLLGLLELHRAGQRGALAQARRVGDNILARKRVGALFLRSRAHRFARLDALEPLALLHLHAALAGLDPASVPAAWPARPYFQCGFLGKGRRFDEDVIYKRLAER